MEPHKGLCHQAWSQLINTKDADELENQRRRLQVSVSRDGLALEIYFQIFFYLSLLHSKTWVGKILPIPGTPHRLLQDFMGLILCSFLEGHLCPVSFLLSASVHQSLNLPPPTFENLWQLSARLGLKPLTSVACVIDQNTASSAHIIYVSLSP